MRSAAPKTFCMYVVGSHILLTPCAADTEGTTQAFYRPCHLKITFISRRKASFKEQVSVLNTSPVKRARTIAVIIGLLMTSFGSSLETKPLVKLAGSHEGTSEPGFALLRTSSSLLTMQVSAWGCLLDRLCSKFIVEDR